MRRLLFLLLLLLTGGCKYAVPLAGNAGLALDPAVTGYWQQTGPGSTARDRHALVLRYSDDEYLVHYQADDKDLYFRGYPVNFAGKKLVQLQLIGTSTGPVSPANRKYDVLRYEISGNTLSAWLLNADVIDRNIDSTASLKQAFHDQAGNPELFRKMGDFERSPETGKSSPGDDRRLRLE